MGNGEWGKFHFSFFIFHFSTESAKSAKSAEEKIRINSRRGIQSNQLILGRLVSPVVPQWGTL
jgi:hypothetical protein